MMSQWSPSASEEGGAFTVTRNLYRFAFRHYIIARTVGDTFLVRAAQTFQARFFDRSRALQNQRAVEGAADRRNQFCLLVVTETYREARSRTATTRLDGNWFRHSRIWHRPQRGRENPPQQLERVVFPRYFWARRHGSHGRSRGAVGRCGA
jgi:hypothetical protein